MPHKTLLISLLLRLLLLSDPLSEFTPIETLTQIGESLKSNKSVFLLFKNDNSISADKLIQNIINELNTNFTNSLPFIDLKITDCEKLNEFCNSDIPNNKSNYIGIMRQSSFRTFEITPDFTLKDVLFKISTLTSEFQVANLDFINNNRLTLLFNFPNNKTVLPQINKIISHITVHSFDPVDFILITENPLNSFDLQLTNHTNRVFMIIDQKIMAMNPQELNESEILEAINWELNSNIEEFSLDNYYRIFMSPIKNKIFLITSNSSSCPELRSIFKNAAFQNRYQDIYSNRLLFVQADIDFVEQSKYQKLNEILWTMAGQDFLSDRDCTVLISGRRKNDNLKYIWYYEIESLENLMMFIDQFNGNRLENKFYVSEFPGDFFYNNTRIMRVIGSSFRQDIILSPTHDFLLVCKQMNMECQSYVYFLHVLASKISDDDLRFGVLDSKKNEMPLLRIEAYPSLLFYRKFRKHRPEIFMKKFSFPAVLEFVNQYLNRIDKKSVNFTKEDQLVYLNLLSEKFPEQLAEIKAGVEAKFEFIEDVDQEL